MKNISPLKFFLLVFLFHSLAIQTINSQGFDGTLGFGLVNLLDSGFTFNAGAGGTYWITDVIGLNAQLFYKVSIFSTEFQRSHIFGSAGLIYSIDLGTNKRIWE